MAQLICPRNIKYFARGGGLLTVRYMDPHTTIDSSTQGLLT